MRGATKKSLTALWSPEELNRLKPLWNKSSAKEKQVILTLRIGELLRKQQKER
jgi:hypothetical protein